MYMLDTQTDPKTQTVNYVTLELTSLGEGDTRQTTIRPVMRLTSALETGWFKLSRSQSTSPDWLVFSRVGDDFSALMQIDLQAEDYTKSIGIKQGFLIKSMGFKKAIARDFDRDLHILRFISPERNFNILKINSEDLTITDGQVSTEWKKALELDPQGVTRFATFARDGDFWVFGNDQTPGESKVTVLAKDQIINLE